MNPRVVTSLVKKDLLLYFQNKFIAVITTVSVVFFILVYYLMPASVNESIKLGAYAPILPAAFLDMDEEGLELVRVGSREALESAVQNGEVDAGLSIEPSDRSITLYFSGSIPTVIRNQIDLFLDELAFLISGVPLPFEIQEEVIGIDMSGRQISLRDRLKPMLAVLILVFETLGLANLITEEVENRTLQALSLTPMRASELFTAKAIAGGSLAFVQSMIFIVAVNGLQTGAVTIVVSLFLGALLSVGLGFLIGAIGKDFLSVLYIGILILIPLFLPIVATVSPGSVSAWVKAIPSYYLADTVSRVSNYGARWADVIGNIGILAAFDALLILAGILMLKRRNTWV